MTTSTSNETSTRTTDRAPQSSRGLSLGSGVAVVGICLVAAMMVAFLCILNYTDILVSSPADRKETTFEVWLIVLAVTLLPGYAGYRLCKQVIEKS